MGELKAPLKSWGDRTLDLPMVMTRGSSACSPVFIMSPIPIAAVQKPLKPSGLREIFSTLKQLPSDFGHRR